MQKINLKIFLHHLQRAAVALVFCFEILCGYFWPIVAIAQPRDQKSEIRDQKSETKDKKAEDTNNISCSIAEKYAIVYSYNTVLGEEPPLKNVNLICIALKKKNKKVVFESVVNYLKSILLKNNDLRQSTGINAFKSIFGTIPTKGDLDIINDIVFEGPVYSYSELKVLLDMNKDRFFELAKHKNSTHEKELELVKKETIEKPKIEKITKKLAVTQEGEILNSGFCSSIQTQNQKDVPVSTNTLQKDASFAYLENIVDVNVGHGAITLDSSEIGSVDPNTISGVASFRGSNELTLLTNISGGNFNTQSISNGTPIGSNELGSPLTLAKEKIQAGPNFNVLTANKQGDPLQNILLGAVSKITGSQSTQSNISFSTSRDLNSNSKIQ